MADDKYRKQLFAILEGIDMPEFERLQLIGGLVTEIRATQGPKLARYRDPAQSAHRVYKAWRDLNNSMRALGVDLEVDHDPDHDEPEYRGLQQ